MKPPANPDPNPSSSMLTGATDASMDPFSPQAQNQLQEFDLLRNQIEQNHEESGGVVGNGNTNNTTNNNGGSTSPNPFDLSEMGAGLRPMQAGNSSSTSPITTGGSAVGGAKPKKSVQSMLGEHSKLVNLDDLVSGASTQGIGTYFKVTSLHYLIFISTFFSSQSVRNATTEPFPTKGPKTSHESSNAAK